MTPDTNIGLLFRQTGYYDHSATPSTMWMTDRLDIDSSVCYTDRPDNVDNRITQYSDRPDNVDNWITQYINRPDNNSPVEQNFVLSPTLDSTVRSDRINRGPTGQTRPDKARPYGQNFVLEPKFKSNERE